MKSGKPAAIRSLAFIFSMERKFNLKSGGRKIEIQGIFDFRLDAPMGVLSALRYLRGLLCNGIEPVLPPCSIHVVPSAAQFQRNCILKPSVAPRFSDCTANPGTPQTPPPEQTPSP